MDRFFRQGLEKIVGKDSVRTDQEALEVFRACECPVPEAVVKVNTSTEVAAVVKLANKQNVPLVVADRDGPVTMCEASTRESFALDFSGMDRVTEFRAMDLCATSEPGITLADLGLALEPTGFFFPPDPLAGGRSSVGRRVLTNQIYPGAEKYGSFRNYVLAMTMVTPTGDLVRLGTRTLKNSSGMQIERFLAGSGGLLGIPTEITLKVLPKEKSHLLLTAGFSSISDGLSALEQIASCQVVPRSLEVADSTWINLFCQSPRVEEIALRLYVGLSGHPEALKGESDLVSEICRTCGAEQMSRASSDKPLERRGEMRGYGTARRDRKLKAFSFRLPVRNSEGMFLGIAEMMKEVDTNIGVYGYCMFGVLYAYVAIDSMDTARSQLMLDTMDGLIARFHGVSGRAGCTSGSEWDYWQDTSLGHDRVSTALKGALDPGSVVMTRSG